MRETPTFVPFAPKEPQNSAKVARFPEGKSPEVLEKRLAEFVYKLESYRQQSRQATEEGQCPGPRDHPGLGDQESMSQRPPASRPASRSPSDGQRITLPPFQHRDDRQQGGRHVEREELEQSGSRTHLPIQPSPQYGRTSQPGTPGEGWRPAQSRDLGVQSMLNPAEPDGSHASHVSGRRTSSGTIDSPISASGQHSQYAPSPTIGTSHSHPGSSYTSPTSEVYRVTLPSGRGSPPRRTLTPRGVRTVSLQGPSQGTIDAQRSPFVPERSRGYTSGPGQPGPLNAPAPAAATPPLERSQQKQHHGFPTAGFSLSQDRRISGGRMQAPSQASPSQSTSPSLSTTSVGLSSNQDSPAPHLYRGGPPPLSGSYFPGSTFAPAMQQAQGGGGVQFQAPSTSGTEGPYSAPPSSASVGSSAGSSRQGSDPTQFLTITTSQGIYNVPVDVHQASRLADEKRARNAGASARFRQRRKEKEKEASTTIEKMQQQTRDQERRIREVESEREFYRSERDRLRDVLFRTPGMRDYAVQGPPSPRQSRLTSLPGHVGQPTGPPPPAMAYRVDHGSSERASRRRRTDTLGEYTNVPYAHEPVPTLPPAPPTGYAPVMGPTSLPPLRTTGPAVTLTSPTRHLPGASGPPPPFDSQPRGAFDRSWPGEGPRR